MIPYQPSWYIIRVLAGTDTRALLDRLRKPIYDIGTVPKEEKIYFHNKKWRAVTIIRFTTPLRQADWLIVYDMYSDIVIYPENLKQ